MMKEECMYLYKVVCYDSDDRPIERAVFAYKDEALVFRAEHPQGKQMAVVRVKA